jgi:hypothetical protein
VCQELRPPAFVNSRHVSQSTCGRARKPSELCPGSRDNGRWVAKHLLVQAWWGCTTREGSVGASCLIGAAQDLRAAGCRLHRNPSNIWRFLHPGTVSSSDNGLGVSTTTLLVPHYRAHCHRTKASKKQMLPTGVSCSCCCSCSCSCSCSRSRARARLDMN